MGGERDGGRGVANQNGGGYSLQVLGHTSVPHLITNFSSGPSLSPSDYGKGRGELSYLAPLRSENISAPYFKQCFFWGGSITPQTESNTTPPSPETEITNILFYILNFASIIKFKM